MGEADGLSVQVLRGFVGWDYCFLGFPSQVRSADRRKRLKDMALVLLQLVGFS